MLEFGTEPMLAAAARDLPRPGALRGGALYEPKFDGYRALAFRTDERVRIQSRRGADLTAAFPDIAAAVADMVPPGVVLDGELVVWSAESGGPAGGMDFGLLQHRARLRGLAAERAAAQSPASMLVFDVLAVEGRDVRHLPLVERKRLLAAVLADARPPLQQVPYTPDEEVARAWLADHAATPGSGVEGLVVKAGGGTYESGVRGWLKVKTRETFDVVVGAVLGSLTAPRALVAGYFAPDGRLRMAGTTTALSTRHRSEVGALLARAAEDHPWPTQISTAWGRPASPIVRVRPALVVEVSADTAFEQGRWRHPVRLVRVRTDVEATLIGPPR